MNFLNDRCGKALWVCMALSFAETGAGLAMTHDFKCLLGDGPEDQQARIQFLRELGDLEKKPDCSLVPLFWEHVDVVEGQELSLGLFRLERSVGSRDAPVGADVISILIRNDDTTPRVWLRVGPEMDSGWIELSEKASTSGHDTFFRSCSGRTVLVGPEFWSDPCQNREDCESQFYLWPRWVEDGEARVLEWVPARRILERAPLGSQGVARWMLQAGGNYSELEAETVASSQWTWKSTIWLADRLDPVSEHVFFPEPSLPRIAGARTQSRIEPRISQLVLTPTTGDDCTRVFGPRTLNPKDKAWGFDWTWKGLPKAETSLNVYTENDGCLRKAPHLDFTVYLRNQHFQVRSLLRDETISTQFAWNGPYVFLEPGGTFFEVVVAANVFGWANEGLAGFDQVYDWLRGRVENLDIYQSLSMSMQPCAARRYPGSVHLPLMCPGYDGFVAKGLCGDVVVHELAHEAMGSLVGLATAGRNEDIDDSTVKESLAYFFALDRNPKAFDRHYAAACQYDDNRIGQGTGDFAESSLLSALADIRDRLQGLGHDPKILGRLLSLSTFYGWPSLKKFFDTFFDIAQDKAQLDDAMLRPICEELRGHARICDPRCPKDIPCYQLSDVEPDGSSLVVRGTFLGTEECPSFAISIADSGRRVESGPGVVPWRRVDDELGRFDSFLPVDPGFDLVLEPICPGMPLEADKILTPGPARLHVAALPKEVLERPVEAESLGLAQVVAAGQSQGRPRLIVGTEPGLLWSRRQSELEAGNSVLDTRIWPGFSATPGGLLQGWTTTGRQVTVRPSAEPGREDRLLGDPLPSWAGRAIASTWPERPLSDDPRLELVGVDGLGITLGTWPEAERPRIVRFPFAREIDPASLEIGWSLEGPVFAVAERYPDTPSVYAVRDGEFQKVPDMAVFPLETPGLSFRRDGLEFARELVERSGCTARPYLRWVGERLAALSCDGIVSAYRLVEQKTVRRIWIQELGGVLQPSVAARPIQMGGINGHPDHDQVLILGPFRHGIGGESEDRIEFVDLLGGERIPFHPIRSPKPIQSAPAVMDLDGDDCDEIVLVTDRVEVWDPNSGLGDCQ